MSFVDEQVADETAGRAQGRPAATTRGATSSEPSRRTLRRRRRRAWSGLIWVRLRSARTDRMKTPALPFTVTEAAVRYEVPDGTAMQRIALQTKQAPSSSS